MIVSSTSILVVTHTSTMTLLVSPSEPPYMWSSNRISLGALTTILMVSPPYSLVLMVSKSTCTLPSPNPYICRAKPWPNRSLTLQRV